MVAGATATSTQCPHVTHTIRRLQRAAVTHGRAPDRDFRVTLWEEREINRIIDPSRTGVGFVSAITA